MVIMVNHEFCHSTIDTDIFPGDKAGLLGTEKQDHICNIHRIPNTAGRLLQGIRAFVDPVIGIDPAGRNGIDSHPSGKARCHGMCQSRNASFGGRIALCLRLAHPVTGR